jgi:hypothetical protein
MDNPKIQDTKISGIDPVTGNEMEVGLDEDGYLTESTIPSSIKIEIPPDKRQYVDGQPILFRGMVVKAYTADGELWTNASHPDGVIPHSELTFPVTTAINNKDSEEWSGKGVNAIRVVCSNYVRTNRYWDDQHAYVSSLHVYDDPDYGAGYFGGYNNVEVLVTKYNEKIYASTIKGTPTKLNIYCNNGKDEFYELRISTTFAPPENEFRGISGIYGNVFNIPESSVDPSTVSPSDLAPVGQTVPVQYIRSDGEVLEDSFTIEVLPDPDGAHPDPTPRSGSIEYNGSYYVANDDLNAEAHYASGTVWNRNTGAIYNTRDAVALGMLIPADGNGSQHVGGDF